VRLRLTVLVILVSFASLADAADSQTAVRDHYSFFEALKIGQKVTLSNVGSCGVEIQVLGSGSVGTETIVEIFPTYIITDDLIGTSRRWTPITSICSIVKLQIPTSRPR